MGVRIRDYILWSTALTPILFTMNAGQRSFSVGVFTAFCFGLALVMGKTKRMVNAHPLFVVGGVALLSFIMTGMNAASVGAMLLLFAFIATVGIVSVIVDKDLDLYPALAVAASVGMASVALERIGFSFFAASSEPGGVMGNAPVLGFLLCVLIPFAYRRNIIVAVMLAVACLAMHEMTGLIVLFVTAFLTEKETRDQLFWGTILAIGVFCAYPQIVQSLNIRLGVWSATLMQIAKQPLFGYGPGVFDSVSGQFITGYWHAENCFGSIMQAVFNCGVLMLGAIAYALRQVWKSEDCPERTAILALAVLSLIEYPLEVIKLWPIYVILVGVYLAKTKEIEYAS